MEIAKKTLDISLIIACVIAVLVDIIFIYYKITNTNYTTGTNYINDQLALDAVNSEELDDKTKNEYEDRWLFDINLYSNYKDNGVILAEMRVNSFSDATLNINTYISSGMQQVGEKPQQKDYYSYNDEFWNTYIDDRYYYYTSADGVTYEGGTSNASVGVTFNRNLKLTVKVGGKPYQLQLTGYRYEYYKDWFGIMKKGDKVVYTWSTFFNDLMYTITRSSYGEGDYYLTKCDLSKYFTLYAYDDKGQVVKDNLTDFVENYCVVKVHYDKNGAKNVNQSLFKVIAGNSSYGINPVNTTYSQSCAEYILNESNLSYRFSETYKGNFIYLDFITMQLFKDIPQYNLNIEINLDKLDKQIVGLDFCAFENFKIDTLTIKGSKTQSLELLDKCLSNTNLKTLKRSSNITLNISPTAINNEFSEVIL